jgi:Gluconate 2-dehydrogenase subunit 3
MDDRYPGYDVLAKRNTPSWNEKTRQVIDQRLAVPREPRFLPADEFATLAAIADRITPQPADREPIPVAALVDDRLLRDQSDGYRHAGMPREREAWRRGLRAIDAEARAAHGCAFRDLLHHEQDALLRLVESGAAHDAAWGGMPPQAFFKTRLLSDIVHAYYCWPAAWNEIGWGGPASPRGYVRLGYDRRDPWEAAEAHGDSEAAREKNRRVG